MPLPRKRGMEDWAMGKLAGRAPCVSASRLGLSTLCLSPSSPVEYLKTTALSSDNFADLNSLKKKRAEFPLGLVSQVENNRTVLNIWVFEFYFSLK